MKQTIKVTLGGKTTSSETELRNEMHFEVQRKTRAQVFKAKKGKGSYVRRPKHREDF